ncbi:hypothetical protein [Marinimicrobium locisalis]|uniref:hypothetical protein n=1 Tax=Marinimicrobium locisalis TaxID=546022 RepID=UPI0032219FCD
MITKSVTTGCAVAMALSISACESTEARPDNSASGEHQAVFDTLFNHLDYRFPSEQHCSNEGTLTVGEFTARALANMSEQQPEHGKIEVTCDKVQADSSLASFYSMDMFPKGTDEKLRSFKENESLMQCQVSFSFSDKDVVWSRAVHFLWNRETEKALESTFRCVVIP